MKISELVDSDPTPQSKTTTLGILGQKGTGKTVSMCIIGNSLNCDTIYFDCLGAITSSGLVDDAMYLQVNSLERDKIIKTLEQAFKKKKRVVLDMGKLIPKEKVYLVDIVCPYLMMKGNTAVFLDELAFICPQNSRIFSDEFVRLVMGGRNENIVPIVFSSQRPQTAHKDVLALADKYLIFRLLHNLDRGKVKDLVGMKPHEWEGLEKKIMALQTRQAYLFYVDEGEIVLKYVEMPKVKIGKGDEKDE